MKNIIEKMVTEEIREIVAKQRTVIEETVAAVLIPELKMVIREAIYNAVGALAEKPSVDVAEPQPMETRFQINGKGRDALSKHRVPLATEAPLSADGNGGIASGAYIYCVAESSERGDLGNIGIDQNRVYTIPFRSLCAVIHDCPARPYASEDPDIVKGWVVAHQDVVDAAWKRYGTVIPIGFDAIIHGDAEPHPEARVQKWLQDDFDNLTRKMAKVRGKAEFGVQVLCDKKAAAARATEESAEIKALTNDIRSKPRGVAYMYRQKLEGLLRKEVENQVDRYFREFYDKIAPHVDDIRVEKTRKTDDPDQQMLLNLSCLLPKEGSQELGDELEKIHALEGFSVRYTGPWAPYSFV